MERIVDKLAKDVEKVRAEQEDLDKIVRSMRDKDLHDLKEQVSSLKAKFWQVAAGYGAVVIVFASLGLNAWIRELPAKIDSEVKQQVKGQVENARAEILTKLNEGMEHLVYASSDFQKALDEYKQKEIGLFELGRMVNDRLENEIVVSLYTDVLLNEREYLSAFELLKTLKERKLIPDEFKRSMIYTNAGCIQWIESLKVEREHQRELVAEARRYLERAVQEAQRCYIKTEIRRPLEWLVFVHLSQGQKKRAMESARQYKKEGGKRAQLVSHTDSQWFRDLAESRPTVDADLRSVLTEVFAEGE